MNSRQAALAIDPVRGIPHCLTQIAEQDLIDLVNVLRENIKRTDELVTIIASTDDSSSENLEANLELDQIAADMELALDSQRIPIGSPEQEALGLLVMKADWPGAAVTEQELAESELVNAIMEFEDKVLLNSKGS